MRVFCDPNGEKIYLADRLGIAGLMQQKSWNLVTNAVITWNTVYMIAVIEQLKKVGCQIIESDVRHI